MYIKYIPLKAQFNSTIFPCSNEPLAIDIATCGSFVSISFLSELAN